MSGAGLSAGERAVLDALRGLRFGSITAVVHDGRLVRVERNEKIRLDDDPTTGAGEHETSLSTRLQPDRRSEAESPEKTP